MSTSRTRPHRSELSQLSGLPGLSQPPGTSELSGRASPEPAGPSGRAMEHATVQDAGLGGRGSFPRGLHVHSAQQVPQGRPEGGVSPMEGEAASLALDANDEALIAEIAEMACGE